MKSLMAGEMKKGTRHAKITGDFGESLILYWLSRQGFEAARIGHTGIDLIAALPGGERRMGISVKSCSRYKGTETTDVGIQESDLDKVRAACKAFGLEPYYAIVVDGVKRLRAFITPIESLIELAPPKSGLCRWRMTAKALAGYERNPLVAVLRWDEAECDPGGMPPVPAIGRA